MPSLIIKRYRSSDRVELAVDNIEALSVQELKEAVSKKMGVPLQDLRLVYGGRVLKTEKKVVDYQVVAGCTIYVMTFSTKNPVNGRPRGRRAGGIVNNRRIIVLFGRILNNPAVLRDMMERSPNTNRSPGLQFLLSNPQFLASFTDPDRIQEYMRNNPTGAALLEQMIYQFVGANAEGGGEGLSEEELVDLLENHMEEELAMIDRDGEVPRARAQDQMFEHSQALHAHQQQRQRYSSSSGAAAVPPPASSASVITQSQLLSALANAMGPSSSSSSQASPLSSGPSSLLSGQPGSLPSNPPRTRGMSNGTGSRPISAATLQQALSAVAGGAQGGSTRRGNPSRQYQEQLVQLRLMGITDETACLHALSATGGDLQAALEILYSK